MPLAISMVALTVVVSTYGLYQYFWGFEQLASFIAHSGSDEVTKIPLLERVHTHRVFSTLALPGTLWGFLVMAIPFHAVLWRKNLASKQSSPSASRADGYRLPHAFFRVPGWPAGDDTRMAVPPSPRVLWNSCRLS
jgi:hypothetical protein